MENYKIKVNNEAESREAQKLFFQLGYEWYGCGAAYNPIDGFKFITAYADEMRLAMGWGEDADKELTPPQLRDLVAKSKSTEQGLISGADALRALADGKEVEVYMEIPNKLPKTKGWVDASICSLVAFAFISPSLSFKFRIKPRTITLNLEIPAPFEPKEGEEFFILAPLSVTGYTKVQGITTQALLDEYVKLGAWRTEEEIKQVVAALRGGIKA